MDTRKEFEKLKRKGILAKECGTVCVCCGAIEGIAYHHILPLCMGGDNRFSNIVPVCEVCHGKVHGTHMTCLHRFSTNTGRPRISKPDGAEEVIDRYIKAEISGVEALKIMGMPRQHSFRTIWFVEEYLKNRGIEEIHTNRGSRDNHATEIWYKDGRIEEYCNGIKVLPGGETTE